MSRNGSAPTRVERFFEDFIIIIFIINRIAEIVIYSISAAQITEIISHAMTTFIAKQDLYNLLIVITKWCFFYCSVYLVPAESFSLPEFYFNKLFEDFFTKFWWKFFYVFQRVCHSVYILVGVSL